MSSLSYLLGGAVPRNTTGTYVAHRDQRAYSYSVNWSIVPPRVRWQATVRAQDGSHAGSPQGAIDLRVAAGDELERWVRAAVELAIERLAVERGVS